MLGNMVFEDMSEILESLSIGVLIVDGDSEITFANKKAFALLGNYYEDVIASHLTSVFDSEALASAVCSVQNDVMDRVPVEFRLQDREVRATVYKVMSEEDLNNITLITLEDLSRFQELVDLKTEFISSLLHSLRTPMTTIKGGMSYLSAEEISENADAFFKEIVDMCSGEVNRLVEFLDDMRDLLLIEAGLAEHDLDQREDDVVAMVYKVAADVAKYAEAKKMTINVQSEHDSVLLECDGRRLKLSLRKIFDNAIIFSAEGSEVNVFVSADDNRVNIDIIDNGIGIPASEIEYIFDKHFRGKNGVTQRVSGNGLGLYIAKFFIEIMNGSILVLSGKGLGTKVKVAFNRK